MISYTEDTSPERARDGGADGRRSSAFRRPVRGYQRVAPYTSMYLPCSSARGEDAAVLRSFFTDAASGAPLAPRAGRPTYLELGGGDGVVESTTLAFDACLRWDGVLLEAHPDAFVRRRRAGASRARSGTPSLASPP